MAAAWAPWWDALALTIAAIGVVAGLRVTGRWGG